eukprot:CAMPEP_0198199640 /NCGR_PEP_ID=MMETSP1445-20131203/2872_1 /TAXON_ID=36898 /ORGANISM="Pyramimonas sp., Strain CCMP2087" /LENGTH=489 /DNA_ID=CAMNT_0043869525 /DNA_START=849 /DNA_END=2318 /DNA_ORIENTATION=-
MPLGREPRALWMKLIPLGVIFFFATFNLTILANLKDALIITTGGAELLPFLASYFVLPTSLAFFFLYSKLCANLQSKNVFYFAIAPLVVFYAFFITVLYPAHAWLHPQGLVEMASGIIPVGLMGMVRVIENWTFSMFFCVAELWGTVVISVLFWTLANELCSVDEAKSVYPLMGIAANVALVISGNYINLINRTVARGSIQASLQWLIGTVVVTTGLMIGAKWFMDNLMPAHLRPHKEPKQKKAKKAMTLKETLGILRSSKKISALSLMVMGYGVCHRLFEFAWKGELRRLFPSTLEYQTVLSNVSIATGSVSIVLMITGRMVFQRFGWGAAAAATPLAMLVLGGAFFTLSLVGLSPLGTAAIGTAAIVLGAVLQVLARSAKFSLFDPAKEMVYIEMTKEEKNQGKAAVDLVGSQMGKSGASWITQALLLTLGSIPAALPYMALIYLLVGGAWLLAVMDLKQIIGVKDSSRVKDQVEDGRLKRLKAGNS